MTLFRPLAALLLAVLAACATAAPPAALPDYYVMRHLQKSDGIDPGLSDEGRANADRLVVLMKDHPPQAIYVSTTRRARETAAPLAAKLGLTAHEYDPRNTPALVELLLKEHGTVLVVGHSNTVPEIIGRLGGEQPAPLAETDYGDVWHVWGEPRRTERLRIVP
ncbi:MAG: SixA phosphatase family protein [Allosphingosinicella sp.]